jgi:hypothetical protein
VIPISRSNHQQRRTDCNGRVRNTPTRKDWTGAGGCIDEAVQGLREMAGVWDDGCISSLVLQAGTLIGRCSNVPESRAKGDFAISSSV